MNIESLKLVDYRNYKEIDINFCKDLNIIYGENAQGKTNILESIFLCASGRSHRTSKDSELIRFDKKSYYIRLRYEKQNHSSQIEIMYESDQKKKIKVNEIPIKKLGNLMGNLNVIIFSPEDLLVIKEGPSGRRRFIDITISQLRPSYFYDLQQYSKILAQRNTLLKEIQKNRSLTDTLDIWNCKLANTGARIMKVRHEFINRLNKFVEINHDRLAGGKEKLCIKYASAVKTSSYEFYDIEKSFKKELERSFAREMIKPATVTGIQRDDYDIFLNDVSLKQFGSQGQQRTAILSVKMAEMDILREETGEFPILLLDDVMSELDDIRQQYLIKNMENVQTFITCTNIDLLRKINDRKKIMYNINAGNVSIEY